MIINVSTNIGIYFLKQKDIVVYIGQSKNLLQRIGTHITEGKKIFDNIEIKECELSMLDEMEEAAISLHRPLYNIKSGENLITLDIVILKIRAQHREITPRQIKDIILKENYNLHIRNFSICLNKKDSIILINKIKAYYTQEGL